MDAACTANSYAALASLVVETIAPPLRSPGLVALAPLKLVPVPDCRAPSPKAVCWSVVPSARGVPLTGCRLFRQDDRPNTLRRMQKASDGVMLPSGAAGRGKTSAMPCWQVSRWARLNVCWKTIRTSAAVTLPFLSTSPLGRQVCWAPEGAGVPMTTITMKRKGFSERQITRWSKTQDTNVLAR